MKKIVARWKIPLSGLLIYIGAAYKRPRLGAQMRPSCITEKMMKSIRNAAEPSQTTNSDHFFQPMSADGRQKITQPLANLAPRFRSRANLSCEVSPPESPNTFAKSHQTTQMSAYGRHQKSMRRVRIAYLYCFRKRGFQLMFPFPTLSASARNVYLRPERIISEIISTINK